MSLYCILLYNNVIVLYCIAQSQQEPDEEDSQLMRLGKTVLTTLSGKQTSLFSLCAFINSCQFLFN